jgi:hypothetical protein
LKQPKLEYLSKMKTYIRILQGPVYAEHLKDINYVSNLTPW